MKNLFFIMDIVAVVEIISIGLLIIFGAWERFENWVRERKWRGGVFEDIFWTFVFPVMLAIPLIFAMNDLLDKLI